MDPCGWKTLRCESPSNRDGISFPIVHLYPDYEGTHRPHELSGKQCWCRPTLERPENLVAWMEGQEFGWVPARAGDDGPAIVCHRETTGLTSEGVFIE